MYLDDVLVGERLVRLVVLGVLEQHLVHISTGVLVELVAGAEDDEGDLAVAEDGELVGLLHHAELPLIECDLCSGNAVRGKSHGNATRCSLF